MRTPLIPGTDAYLAAKADLLRVCGVPESSTFDAASAVRARIDYLKAVLRDTGLKGFVLGVSGGVDSTTVARLCQSACSELRAEGFDARFVAVRLPAGVQRDEADARLALDFVAPDIVLECNVGAASAALSDEGLAAFVAAGLPAPSAASADFAKGNIKARLRMAAQYQIAGLLGMLVVGTDHNSENATGFFTKWGDGACDLIVLDGVNKTQVRLMARELGAPERLVSKTPTADLEELNPGKPDDEGFGFEYAKLDRFLEGLPVDAETEAKIVNQYVATAHKRAPILSFGACRPAD